MGVGGAVKINNYQRPVNLLEIAERGKARTTGADSTSSTSFRDLFSEQLGSDRGVAFSRHAEERLHSRGIMLTQEQLGRISQAIDKAESKGSRETLILTDDTALVVSVKNRTVITAFDRENLREGIVTSIDSAVIL
jgi:flagellar operon protein